MPPAPALEISSLCLPCPTRLSFLGQDVRGSYPGNGLSNEVIVWAFSEPLVAEEQVQPTWNLLHWCGS